MRIYVGNLGFQTTKQGLRAALGAHGKVSSASIITDRGRSRGFGFVEMPDESEARAAIEAMNETELDGRILTSMKRARRGIARAVAAKEEGVGRPPEESRLDLVTSEAGIKALVPDQVIGSVARGRSPGRETRAGLPPRRIALSVAWREQDPGAVRIGGSWRVIRDYLKAWPSSEAPR